MHSSEFSEISEKQKPEYFTTKLLEKANELSLLFLLLVKALRQIVLVLSALLWECERSLCSPQSGY